MVYERLLPRGTSIVLVRVIGDLKQMNWPFPVAVYKMISLTDRVSQSRSRKETIEFPIHFNRTLPRDFPYLPFPH